MVFASHDPRMSHPHTVKQHETAFNILMFIIKMTWCEPNDGKMRWFTLVPSLYCSKVRGLWATWIQYDSVDEMNDVNKKNSSCNRKKASKKTQNLWNGLLLHVVSDLQQLVQGGLVWEQQLVVPIFFAGARFYSWWNKHSCVECVSLSWWIHIDTYCLCCWLFSCCQSLDKSAAK